jgi:hypothetical protein
MLRGLAKFSVSAQPAHGREDAGGAGISAAYETTRQWALALTGWLLRQYTHFHTDAMMVIGHIARPFVQSAARLVRRPDRHHGYTGQRYTWSRPYRNDPDSGTALLRHLVY